MAFSSASTAGNNAATMGDINVTPLVDVMLVLLIIFMVTTPLLSKAIQIDLPQIGPITPEVDPPDPIRLRIDADGSLSWNNAPLSRAAMVASLQVEATRDPQPMLELETSGDASYNAVADVLAAAKRNGMAKIGFVDVR